MATDHAHPFDRLDDPLPADATRELLAEDYRHEIDTGYYGFGWIMQPKIHSLQLGLPINQPALYT